MNRFFGITAATLLGFLSCAQAQTNASSAGGASPVSPAGSPIFVLNSNDANVSVIDPHTWTIKATIPTGKEPHHLYLSPDEKSVLVANAVSDSLTLIDPKTATIQRTIYHILDPYQLRFSPDMKYLATAANRLNHVDLYDWSQQPGENAPTPHLIQRFATGKTPSHLWFDAPVKTLYATMQDSDELIAIDLVQRRIKWRIKTGPLPADVFGPDFGEGDKRLLVGLTGGMGVEVFDVSGPQPKRTGLIPTGRGAHAFRAAGDKKHVFVSNRDAKTVSKLNYETLRVVATYPAGFGADCMEVMGSAKKLLVSTRWEKKLTVIDLETGQMERQVRVGNSPHGVWTLDHASRH